MPVAVVPRLLISRSSSSLHKLTHPRAVPHFPQVVETLENVGVLQPGTTLTPEQLVAPEFAVDADSS
jgi:hypothetical protein